jgi:hypothetical protein
MLIFLRNIKLKILDLRFNFCLFFKNFFLLPLNSFKKNLINFFYSLKIIFLNLNLNLMKIFGNFFNNKLNNINLHLIPFNTLKKDYISFSVFSLFNISFKKKKNLLEKFFLNNLIKFIKKLKFINKSISIFKIKKIIKF